MKELLTLAALMAMLLFVGCGGQKEATAPTEEANITVEAVEMLGEETIGEEIADADEEGVVGGLSDEEE